MPRGSELRSSDSPCTSAAIGMPDAHVIPTIPDSRGHACRGQPMHGAHEARGEMTVGRGGEYLRDEKHETGWLFRGGP